MCGDPVIRTVSSVEVVDRICGMTIETHRAAAFRAAGDSTVYFCSAGCAQTFDRERSRSTGVLRPAVALHRSRHRARGAMAGSIVVAVGVTVGLLVAGLGSTALSIGAAVLLLSCLVVCVVAVVIQNRALRQVQEAADALAERRRSARSMREH